MFAEQYGFTPDQVGAMTLRQISVFFLPTNMGLGEAAVASRNAESERRRFIELNLE